MFKDDCRFLIWGFYFYFNCKREEKNRKLYFLYCFDRCIKLFIRNIEYIVFEIVIKVLII